MTRPVRSILLAHSNLLSNDPKQMRKMRPYPPLATLQAAGLLREAGFDVALYDPTFEDDLDAFARILERVKPGALLVYEDYFNFIAKMCLSCMRRAALDMCRMARAAGAAALVAGPDATDYPEAYLLGGADYVLTGEADLTAVDVCRILMTGADPIARGVPGVAGLTPDGSVQRTRPRPLAEDLDSFPAPAWDLVDVEAYRRAWRERHRTFSLNMVSSRGCPYACTWCAKPIWGTHYAQRTPSQVAAEMAWLARNLEPDHIWFADDVFGHDAEWLAGFQAALEAEGARVPYTIQTRADLLSPHVVAVLRQTGCMEVWLGVESGSPRVLAAMNKRVSPDRVRAAAAELKSAGIRACFFLQFGYPGETFSDVQATIALVRELVPDDIGVSISYPLPGTKLYRSVRAALGAKTHWQHSDDLTLLFQGAYTTSFYRKLHQLLHAELDLRRRIGALQGADGSGIETMLAQTMEGWMTLGLMEATHRRPAEAAPMEES